MKKEKARKMKNNRENEKGAAMVMVLLISFLLLTASIGLLLETSMNTANITDSTAEQQAYNAAESGIQSAINVLRGNTAPSPLLDTSKASTDPANQIDFKKAILTSTSNKPGDTAPAARLSRWLTYSTSNPDRVTLGTGYTVQSGNAFSVTVSDPDNTGTVVSYYTTGKFYQPDAGYTDRKTFGSSTDYARITYVPTTVTDMNVSAGSAVTNLGKFTTQINGAGASIPTDFTFTRFEIKIVMTKPYSATRIVRGYIESGNITNSSVTAKILYDTQAISIMGSIFTFDSGASIYQPNVTPQRVGYEVPLNVGDRLVSGSMTAAEPTRILIRSIGYGPRGARKELEAIVRKNFFDGLSAPATLTLVGPASTTTPASTSIFAPGSSNVTQYSGDDVVSSQFIPPIGATNTSNLANIQNSVSGLPPHPFNGTVIGTPSNVSDEMPDWLSSPAKLDTAVAALYNVAYASGRYFPAGTPVTGGFGDNATAKGITFINGDATFTGSGGGILVCTGTLTLHGNFSFNGLIISTGAGGITRSGGGTGTLQGNVVVAPYRSNKIGDDKSLLQANFLAPRYDLSGGGNSTIIYNSSSVANGLTAVSNFVLGVAEK
jgi:hypothetical protein